MWIGIALVVTASGGFVTQAQPFFTEAECKAQTAYVIGELEKSQGAKAYRLDCVDAATLTVRKSPLPAPKEPPASKPERALNPRSAAPVTL